MSVHLEVRFMPEATELLWWNTSRETKWEWWNAYTTNEVTWTVQLKTNAYQTYNAIESGSKFDATVIESKTWNRNRTRQFGDPYVCRRGGTHALRYYFHTILFYGPVDIFSCASSQYWAYCKDGEEIRIVSILTIGTVLLRSTVRRSDKITS